LIIFSKFYSGERLWCVGDKKDQGGEDFEANSALGAASNGGSVELGAVAAIHMLFLHVSNFKVQALEFGPTVRWR